MTLGGAWQDALDELRRLGERFTEGVLNQRALGHAAYQRGEIHRLRGELGAAEAAYREASRFGREPQPGLALLRLAQGKDDAAAAAIRRAVSETTQPLKRAALLPAYVEIMLAVGDIEAARSACRELDEIAERQGTDLLGCDGGSGPRRGGAGRGRRPSRPGRAAPRLPGMAGARRAARGRACPRAARSGLPHAGRRGHGGVRAGGRTRRLHRPGRGARPRLDRLPLRPRRARPTTD